MHKKADNPQPDWSIDGSGFVLEVIENECVSEGVAHDEVVQVFVSGSIVLYAAYECHEVNGFGDVTDATMCLDPDLKTARTRWPRSVEKAHQAYYETHGRYPRNLDEE